MEKIAILGASTGLGKALAYEFDRKKFQLLLSSRKKELLVKTLSKLTNSKPTKSELFSSDFTLADDQKNILLKLQEFSPDHIIYCAGGGAYGNFEEKKWTAHQWTYELNFIFPSELIYFCLNGDAFKNLKNFIYIGSQVADNKPDAMAASYCASKHAMRGLITSIQAEKREHACKVRLFCAPYMNTSMLPSKAWPRQVTGFVQEPELIAQKFSVWFESEELNYE